MATNFISYWTCSLGAEVSQDPLDRFSQSLHRMIDIEWQMINPTFFYRYLQPRCHVNQFSGKNGAKLPTPCTLSFRNGMGYCLANTRINSSTNCSTSCEKMVKVGTAVSELKWGRKSKLSCKLTYIAKYLNSFYQGFSFCTCIYADYKTDISFPVVQGMLLW